METGNGGQVSEELAALGRLPSEAELSALIERYAGSQRVTCELADEFFASVAEVTSARTQSDRAAREVEEVAGGSWLDKIGAASSAPPRARSVTPTAQASSIPGDENSRPRPRRSSAPPALVITPLPSPPESVLETMSVERLPAATYSSLPPASALPGSDAAPIALPLSSRPALLSQPPIAAAVDSVLLEQWGPAQSALDAFPPFDTQASASMLPLQHPLDVRPASNAPSNGTAAAARASSIPPLPRSVVPPSAAPVRSVEEALASAEEDALLDQWSDDLAAASPSGVTSQPPTAASTSDVAPAADEPEPWNANATQPEREYSAARVAPLSERPSASSQLPLAAARMTEAEDAPLSEQPRASSQLPLAAAPLIEAEDAPLSAAELSLLDNWAVAAEVNDLTAPSAAKPESAITGGFVPADYTAAVYAPSDSRRKRSQQPPPLGASSAGVSVRSLSMPAPAPSRAARLPAAPPALAARMSAAPPAFSMPPPAMSATSTSRPPVPAAALVASQRPPAAAVDRHAAHTAHDADDAHHVNDADDAELDDVALEDEIELDPDDLIEVDND